MSILVIPRATEKAYGLSKNDVYVFEVPASANKNEIKAAVEATYNVTVVNISTLVQKGKAVRFVKSKRAYPATTFRKDSKKAYVTLKDGDSIKIFEEAATEEKK